MCLRKLTQHKEKLLIYKEFSALFSYLDYDQSIVICRQLSSVVIIVCHGRQRKPQQSGICFDNLFRLSARRFIQCFLNVAYSVIVCEVPVWHAFPHGFRNLSVIYDTLKPQWVTRSYITLLYQFRPSHVYNCLSNFKFLDTLQFARIFSQ